ncbi:LysM peptidoglycan-binding domain-containing protein [Elusimicrobiota bacterium]
MKMLAGGLILAFGLLAFCAPDVSAKEKESYVIVRGDTLWDLAALFYNDPFRWKEIYDANKDQMENPDIIYPEQLLFVPGIGFVKALPKEEPKLEVKKEAPPAEMPEFEKEEPPTIVEQKEEPKAEEPKAVKTPPKPLPKIVRPPYVYKPDGRIIGVADSEKILLTQGDLVYIDIGTSRGLVPGDELWVMKRLRRVRHPKTKKHFWIVNKAGKMVTMDSAERHKTACKIISAKEPIVVGDEVKIIPRN